MKEAHGKHNCELCDHLLEQGGFNDWVITTAFYSSIHYIDHKLFPLDHEGTTYMDFAEIHKEFTKNRQSRSPHQTRTLLVFKHLPSTAANYEFLKENCENARYLNYQVSKAKAKKARQRLTQIIDECKSATEAN